MEQYVKIEAEEVAREILSDPEFGMDILAHLADGMRSTRNFTQNGATSRFHLGAG